MSEKEIERKISHQIFLVYSYYIIYMYFCLFASLSSSSPSYSQESDPFVVESGWSSEYTAYFIRIKIISSMREGERGIERKKRVGVSEKMREKGSQQKLIIIGSVQILFIFCPFSSYNNVSLFPSPRHLEAFLSLHLPHFLLTGLDD